MRGPYALWKVALLLVAAVGPPGAWSAGNVGCLFSEKLCDEKEWCFDDRAFGRCLEGYGESADDLYQYDLDRQTLHQLEREIRRLLALGYRWAHAYTQCELRGLLAAAKFGEKFETGICSHLADQDLEGALGALQLEVPVDPESLAFVRYAPSASNPNSKYADEVFYPPEDEGNREDVGEEDDRPYGWYVYRETPKRSAMMPRKQADTVFSRKYNTPDGFRYGEETRDEEPPYDLEQEGLKALLGQQYSRLAEMYLEAKEEEEEEEMAEEEQQMEQDERMAEARMAEEDRMEELARLAEAEAAAEEEQRDRLLQDKEFHFLKDNDDRPGIYTEGGVVYVPEEPAETDKPDGYTDDDLAKIISDYEWAFKRPERLDVKKPGPPFDPRAAKEVVKKEPRGAASHPLHDHSSLNEDYVYITLKNGLKTWKEGSDIVQNVTRLLKLKEHAFVGIRVDRNEVTFRVLPNNRQLNATLVAREIVYLREDLERAARIQIADVGVGDKVKLPAIREVTIPVVDMTSQAEDIKAAALLAGGAIAAITAAAVALVLIRRHIRSLRKLRGLSRGDSEPSRDYQDLCRARMASKQQPQAVASLSRESEPSPSSRSSTSSWSEEPALSNMDISTGHMVLAYMEDHLRNGDRLEREWEALCAYEAEPGSVAAATRSDNAAKNRSAAAVPYDHARVVLNALANQANQDYVNASSITDHDPRNPAYIAAQGPLPNTAADFWQMIWEQGAVVLVMLTRLTESGSAQCHRYWPEEGSELHHVYEVHLVSEHIWCDDYLVRSFYLKNTRTGETRTVTQFHFLSWPEGGVPASTRALLEFRRKVNRSYRGRACPIVVHCSDGAGRTGTYVLIDMVLNRMAKGAKEIDIAATLEHIRDQRPGMVTTRQQFEFVLTAVAEEVHAILKALPAAQTHSQQQQQQQPKEQQAKEQQQQQQQ